MTHLQPFSTSEVDLQSNTSIRSIVSLSSSVAASGKFPSPHSKSCSSTLLFTVKGIKFPLFLILVHLIVSPDWNYNDKVNKMEKGAEWKRKSRTDWNWNGSFFTSAQSINTRSRQTYWSMRYCWYTFSFTASRLFGDARFPPDLICVSLDSSRVTLNKSSSRNKTLNVCFHTSEEIKKW